MISISKYTVLNLDKLRTSCCFSKVSGCYSYNKSSMLVHLVGRLFPKTTFIRFNLYSVHTLKKRKHLLAFKVSHLYKHKLTTKKKVCPFSYFHFLLVKGVTYI